MLGIQGSCFNVQDSHLVWVVFQVFQPTNDIQRSYITLQQSSIFWRASQWIHLGPAMTLVTFTRPCPLKKSFRRLSVCKLLSISKAGPLIKNIYWHNGWQNACEGIHLSATNHWWIYGTNCISYHRIYQDVANMFIKKTRVFAWYLLDRSPKCFALFILTGTGVADGSYWDSKAKANEAVQHMSMYLWQSGIFMYYLDLDLYAKCPRVTS